MDRRIQEIAQFAHGTGLRYRVTFEYDEGDLVVCSLTLTQKHGGRSFDVTHDWTALTLDTRSLSTAETILAMRNDVNLRAFGPPA